MAGRLCDLLRRSYHFQFIERLYGHSLHVGTLMEQEFYHTDTACPTRDVEGCVAAAVGPVQSSAAPQEKGGAGDVAAAAGVVEYVVAEAVPLVPPRPEVGEDPHDAQLARYGRHREGRVAVVVLAV